MFLNYNPDLPQARAARVRTTLICDEWVQIDRDTLHQH